MSEYDHTFDPKILIGHYDLMSRLSDFVLYLGTQMDGILTNFFHTMFAYDKTFGPKVVLGHYDLISRFSLPYISALNWRMTRPLTLKYSYATVT